MNRRNIFISTDTYGRKDSFAHGFNFYKLFWLFLIGCITGYGVETIWCYLRCGYFENRQGLIYGPFSPIYGLGTLLYTVLFCYIRNYSSFTIFTLCSLIGGTFEYLCSLAQEFMFGTISWEYSTSPLNLQGRTNLTYTIYWGLLGLIFVKHTLPFLIKGIERIPNCYGKILSWLLFILLFLNILISAAAVRRQTNRHHGIPANNAVSAFLDTHYSDEFLQKIYPNMQIVRP